MIPLGGFSLLKLNLIFKEWSAALFGKDKTKDAVRINFEELFQNLKNEGATLEDANTFLDKAIKAHSPSPALIKNVYKKLKAAGSIDTYEKEFADDWIKNIADKATNVFFEIFPVQKTQVQEESKMHGNISAQEYKALHKLAESFPRLDTEELENKLRDGTYDPMTDLPALLGKLDGTDK